MSFSSQIKEFVKTNPLSKEMYYRLSYIMTKTSPELFCRILYRIKFKKHLDLKNPKTLNEKSIWLKLNTYRDNPLVQKCADKYRVREYVTECGCGEILNELYGVWDSVDDIDWDSLPEQFVLKSNHSSGDVQICTDKRTFDYQKAKQVLRQSLKRDYSVYQAELMYAEIPRKIICEKYLETNDGFVPVDYKILCFNGIPRYILYCAFRDSGRTRFRYYDLDWNVRPILWGQYGISNDIVIPRPQNLDIMLKYAEVLATPFPFVRVDFYDVEGIVYFGELTFAQSGGFEYKRLWCAELALGESLHLPTLDARVVQ